MKTILILCSLFFSISIYAQSTSEEFLAAGIAKYDANDFAGAIKDFDAGLKLNSKSIETYYRRGKSKFRMRNNIGASTDYAATLRITATSSKDYLYLGKSKIEMGHYTSAIVAINKAIELEPKNLDAYISRGYAEAMQKNYVNAISDYNKALEINPKSALVYYKRGSVYLKSGEEQKACSDFQKAMELGSKEAAKISAKKCPNNSSSPTTQEVKKESPPVAAQQQAKSSSTTSSKATQQNAGSPAAVHARQMGWSITSMETAFASDKWREIPIETKRAYTQIEIIITRINQMRALDPNYGYSEYLSKLDKCRSLYFAEVGFPKPELFDFTKHTTVEQGKISPFNYEGTAESRLKKVRQELASLEKMNQIKEEYYPVNSRTFILEQFQKTETALKKTIAAEPNLDMTSLTKELEFYKKEWNAFTVKKKAKAEALVQVKLEGLKRLYAPVKDNGMTSSLHSKFVKKIVFSKSEIPEKSPSETALVTSFKLGDPLYLRAFFARSTGNEFRERFVASNCEDTDFAFLYYYPPTIKDDKATYILNDKEDATYKIKTFINDQPVNSGSFFFKTDDGNQDIDKRTTGDYDVTDLIKEFHYETLIFNKLKAGTHQIRIEFWALSCDSYKSQVIKLAEGQISFTCSEAEITNFRRKIGVTMPREFITDESLKAKMVSTFKAKNPSYSFLRLEIVDDWLINRAFTGIILNRSRTAVVAYKEDGVCRRTHITFFQEHDGSKFEKTTQIKADPYSSSSKIDCRDVNY
jgi:tetratricopeptide (TPR) repeat protein